MKQETATERVPLLVAVVATGAATALGAGARAVASTQGWEFPSWGETALELAWMLGLLAIAFLGFKFVAGRWPSFSELGLGQSDIAPAEQRSRRPIARRGILACVLAFGVFGAIGFGHDSGGTGSTTGFAAMSAALVVITFAVRWPISVIAQQVLFFGWLQPRLGRYGLPITIALYSLSHVATPASMIYIIPLGGVFAIERWQTGRIRASIATHYLVNVALFALSVNK